MPITRAGRFVVTPDLGITPSPGIKTNLLNDLVREIDREGIAGIFGNPAFGVPGNVARCAASDPRPALPNLEDLQCHYCRNLRSLSGLQRAAPNPR